ncbi:hypothetical protein EHW99_3105 [Erwinia amylovora]|uniref:Uncharacterized protein n=2 Tax=Erwinia amylovora TaxID=552 RepID=A0A831A1I1_ERWAM|nr:hypothetical protein EaACW_0478 [Erwinia amylovora ACW56400]QJQ55804.1 hypothetical protein EHX00_3105 [Erwinia amylovora]CBA19423.1 hypothetical protein predicted by Glimmer/Critica [Erwinia amylovora CFBP1430]CCO77323.1 hypothetical protein BN432_0491 [Erwinia amylovora Ea356]CCO81107.1 hypothetical protein BN433_0501 [Erwinia amylovora Ea266]CCO84913.1 hypothetical protein BN434_0491 [Erwinia amylovora CFBP 2585]CCO88698.1 hypothetical protein BN435_0491 [Erwinia amylovora 01SFR-BO]CCO
MMLRQKKSKLKSVPALQNMKINPKALINLPRQKFT